MKFPDFSLTFLVFKISLTNLQNSLTFQEGKSNFPDFSLTSGHPDLCVQSDLYLRYKNTSLVGFCSPGLKWMNASERPTFVGDPLSLLHISPLCLSRNRHSLVAVGRNCVSSWSRVPAACEFLRLLIRPVLLRQLLVLYHPAKKKKYRKIWNNEHAIILKFDFCSFTMYTVP